MTTRCLITHSLLSSWLYAMKDNPYEDMTTERDPMEEFLLTLRREPTPTTDAMKNGIVFEDLVTDIIRGTADIKSHWYTAAENVAGIVGGGSLQYKASKSIEVCGMALLLYGRLDCLKSGEIYDIKFSKGYERGKYLGSTQHPAYLELIPEAKSFTYIVSNGNDVWTERYLREETQSIIPIIEDFLNWLSERGLLDVYKEKWQSK